MAQLVGMTSLLQNMRIPDPVVVQLPSPPALQWGLTPNNWLTKAQPFAVGIKGPQSLIVVNGYVYTVDRDGWVMEIAPNGSVRRIIRLAISSCGQSDAKEGACGKPLAIRADSQGYLIVADANHGIFRISPQTGQYKLLVDARNLLVNNKPLGFINDLAVARDGTVFFTSSSSRWRPSEYRNIIIEGETSGRVLRYNPRAQIPTDIVKQLLEGLNFPDGLQLAPDESYLLVGESARCRIFKVHIGPGSKHGTIEDFVANLPGFPLNIRLSRRRTYWVGLSNGRHRGLPSLLDTRGSGTPANLTFRKDLIARPQVQAAALSSKFGIAVELDMNGNIIRSIQDPQGSMYTTVNEIAEEEDVLYIVSPDTNFIGLLNVNWLPAPNPAPKLPPTTPRPRPITTPSPRPNKPTNSTNASTSSSTSNPGAILDPNDPNAAEIAKLLETVKENMKKLTEIQIRELVVQLTRQLVETKTVIYKANERAVKLEKDLESLQTLTDTSGLSVKQKQLVQDSWANFSSGNNVITDTTHMFVRLFSLAPEAAALFSFVPSDALNEQALLGNTRVRAHVQRVVNALDSAVNGLNNIPNLVAVTKDLGARHASYRVQEKFFQPIIQGVLYALEKKLGGQFTEEKRQAWTAVLSLITTNMKLGLREGQAAMQATSG